MAKEVYQLKVKNEPVTLGKGPNNDDAFTSFTDVYKKTISGFAYLNITLTKTGEKLQIIFPVTSAFLSGWPNIINIIQAKDGKPWPVLGGWSESLKLPITGLLPNAIKDGEGGTHDCIFQEISFVWFKNYF